MDIFFSATSYIVQDVLLQPYQAAALMLYNRSGTVCRNRISARVLILFVFFKFPWSTDYYATLVACCLLNVIMSKVHIASC